MIAQLPPKGSVLTLLSVLALIKSQCHLLLLRTSCVVYNKGDVEVQIGSIKSMSDADKYALIQDPYVPPIDYVFPKHVEYGKQRSFQRSWLRKYPWLVYSKYLDGGFCLPCYLFTKCTSSSERMLVEKPMNKYTKASDHHKGHSYKKTSLCCT